MAEKEKKQKKEKSFEQELLIKETPYNIFVAGYMTFYMLYFSQAAETMGIKNTAFYLLVSVLLVGLLQIFVAPVTNHLVVGKASKLLAREKEEEVTAADRGLLVKALMTSPKRMMINVGCVFGGGVCLITFVLYRFFISDFKIIFMYFFSGIFMSYIASLVGYIYTETLCSAEAIKIIKKGIDIKTVRKEKFYGQSLIARMIFSIGIVAVLSNVMVFYFYYQNLSQSFQGYSITGLTNTQTTKILIMLVLNTVVSIVFAYIIYWQISNSYKEITRTLEDLLENVEQEDAFLSTDLSNNFSYSYFLINGIISYFHEMVTYIINASKNILDATENLSVTATETAETAIEEATSVKECLVAIEGLSTVLGQISKRINNVSTAAANTKFDVDEGYELLRTEIIEKKINEITNANIDTILGIKDFNEKIENVWNIINTIDIVAEKTKIIAFNAELEATEAGEKGETFHIIANEIRRLATTITDSTQKIKLYIKSIQEFSDNLIVTSEVGTQKIREGSAFFSSLEEKFSDLRIATDITAESAMSIQQITDTQNSAFEQINTTFGQISVGFDQFSQSAQYVNKVAEDLREISVKLEDINKKTAVVDAEASK